MSQLDVSQPHVLEDFDLPQDRGHRVKELYCLVDGHVKYIGNGLALEFHLQRLAVVALAAAFLTGDQHIGQEIHLDGLIAVAVALLASPATGVE